MTPCERSPLRHGTTTCYRNGCRCPDCRAASARQRRYQARRAARGEVAYVDAQPVREHVARLRAGGLRVADIRQRADIPAKTLSALLYGRGAKLPTQKMRPWHATAILAILAPPPMLHKPRTGVPAGPTRARIRALNALGYPTSLVAGMLGMSDNFFRSDHDNVQRETERRVAELADRLAGTRGPSERARAMAARRGWTTDALWADLTEDAPAVVIDDVLIDRVITGDPGAYKQLTDAERLEAARRMLAAGRHSTAIGRALHMNTAYTARLLAQLDDEKTGAA